MVRFGIVGTGRISDWVLRGALQDPRFKAVAVCSRKMETAEAFVAAHPAAFPEGRALLFTSVEEMAASPEVDAIYIGTPNNTHCEMTLAALKGGKHVLCEKPLACNADEVRRMIEASRESGCALMEAMVSTVNPLFRKAREMMGEIGPIRHFNASYCQYSTKYDKLRAGEIPNTFNPTTGGGALADIGVYTTFPAVALFGRPDVVKSDIVFFPTALGPVDVHGTIELGYKEMTAVLSFSKVVDSVLPTEICGEKGNLLLDALHICRSLSLAPHVPPSAGRGPLPRPETVASGLEKDEYFYEFEEFINVVESGRIESTVNSHEVSLINREVMDLALRQAVLPSSHR
ncbi:MAG: Gfo/Idh/MocA family oxidoreductase [Bacteroidales bacterium]|nr:Gfo/Idh/MocA family oxidoreductase [Bacteroidales bacterium]